MSHHEEGDAIWDRISKIRVAMLTSVASDGALESRPMYTQEEGHAEGLVFLTSRSADKTRDLVSESMVNISYSDPSDHVYVSVSGRARVLDDREKVRELWHPMNEAFFPDGPDDPDLVVLQVEPLRGEYWDAPSGRMRQIAGIARALFTGKRYDQGENEEVRLD